MIAFRDFRLALLLPHHFRTRRPAHRVVPVMPASVRARSRRVPPALRCRYPGPRPENAARLLRVRVSRGRYGGDRDQAAIGAKFERRFGDQTTGARRVGKESILENQRSGLRRAIKVRTSIFNFSAVSASCSNTSRFW